MLSNVVPLEPSAAAAAPADHLEPLSAAILEVSALLASNCDERRRLHARLDELRASPRLRRRRARTPLPVPSRGAGREEIEAELLALSSSRCVPPLDAEEVRKIAVSAAKYPAGR